MTPIGCHRTPTALVRARTIEATVSEPNLESMLLFSAGMIGVSQARAIAHLLASWCAIALAFLGTSAAFRFRWSHRDTRESSFQAPFCRSLGHGQTGAGCLDPRFAVSTGHSCVPMGDTAPRWLSASDGQIGLLLAVVRCAPERRAERSFLLRRALVLHLLICVGMFLRWRTRSWQVVVKCPPIQTLFRPF